MSIDSISLITSLYRSETHLPAYIQRVRAAAQALTANDIHLQIVIIANDATPNERALLDELHTSDALDVALVYVPREPLYASWNRGVDVADSDWLGIWNVDDIRTVDAIVQACGAFRNGAELVDMPYYIATADDVDDPTEQRPPFDPIALSPKRCLSPFFFFRRTLFQRAGRFDDRFKITGDLEWCWREPVRQSQYVSLDTVGGVLMLHGNNLSNGTHSLEWVEINIVLLWHEMYDQLRPVDPQQMQIAWDEWAGDSASIPDAIADWLWGEGADERYRAYQRERAAYPLVRRMRLALARRGLISSVEWDAHHKPKIAE